MSTYKKVIQENQRMVQRLCDVSGLRKGLVQNIVRFVKCLVEPNCGQIDRQIFNVVLSKYFDIVDQNFVRLIFDRSVGNNPLRTSQNLNVEDFSRLICIFLSEDLEIKMEYVFKVYDLNHDGLIEMNELTENIRRCKCITDVDDSDKDETFMDLFMMTSELLGLNSQPPGHGLELETFRAKVRQNSLILGILGQSLPKMDVQERFKHMVTGKTNIQMQEAFGNVRQELLYELPTSSGPQYYSIKLDLP